MEVNKRLITKLEIEYVLRDILDSLEVLKEDNVERAKCISLARKLESFNLNSIEDIFDSINERFNDSVYIILDLVENLINDLNECYESSEITRISDDKIEFILFKLQDIVTILDNFDTYDMVSDNDIEFIKSLVDECLLIDDIKQKEKSEYYKKKQKATRRNSDGLTPKQKELLETKEKVIILKDQGLSIRKIADQLNIDKSKVQRLLKLYK